ncbi:prepilin-type N-terminal cleavage/methylation domain-containing protein [Pseudoduganella sp. FT93W]|uniref:Type II secretion system protein J n=1 Tax=Duganella fentianensis TaxID=2692177 RepID=A0A845HZG4_9BURK|nr:prepilin-type N-terminal cleavage/methylation domain-containing protein [Duganella fentianensis]MYN46423.1 prepilin-type N-terminal cleavage/methylation domain-containing protein [Duganella fentianensis]
MMPTRLQRQPACVTPRARGFTLIELLVAISILAIVAVLGWRGLDGIIRSRSALTQQMGQTRGMQLAFAQMQSDAANLAPATLLQGRAYLQAENQRLTLVRLVLNDMQPTRLQVVSYRLRNGELLRRESVATRDLQQLDALWQAALGNDDQEQQGSVALQGDVQGLSVRYWIGTGWVPAAGISTAGNLKPANEPTGMEVALTLQDGGQPLVKSFLLGAL